MYNHRVYTYNYIMYIQLKSYAEPRPDFEDRAQLLQRDSVVVHAGSNLGNRVSSPARTAIKANTGDDATSPICILYIFVSEQSSPVAPKPTLQWIWPKGSRGPWGTLETLPGGGQ